MRRYDAKDLYDKRLNRCDGLVIDAEYLRANIVSSGSELARCIIRPGRNENTVDVIGPEKNKRFLTWFVAPLAIIIVIAVTYSAAPNNTFHLDDHRNIVRHTPVLINELTVGNVIDAGRDAYLPNRPLPSMTFAIDWWRGDGSARPFQWTNIVIHAATAVAVFGLLLMVLGRLRYPPWIVGVASLVGALLWACHPIQIQGVTYIVQRMTSMAALFTVLTVVLYLLGRGTGRTGRQWLYFGLSGLCWILGMASKETAAITPFLILLTEYGVLRHGQPIVQRKIDRLILAFPVLVAGLIVLDFLSGVGPLSTAFLSGYELRDFTITERLLTQPRVIGFHLSQILWPLPGRFSLEHGFAISTGLLTPASTLLALLGVVAWCVLGVWLLFRVTSRVFGYFLLWVPATLVIESTFIPLELVFEHRMYLPGIGLAGLAGMAICWLLHRMPRFVPLTIIACMAVVVLLMTASGQQIPVWQTSLSLAENSVRRAPNLARAWSILAKSRRDAGYRWDRVLPAVNRALALDPMQGDALNLKAISLIERRRLDEAEEILEALAPKVRDDHSILNTMGMLRFERGNFPAAIERFEQVIELDGFVPEFAYNLALSYEYAGRCRDAKAIWLSYQQTETDETRRSVVRERLRKNFATEGGRCFGVAQ